MRCKNIEVTLKIPMALDKEDENGVYYSKEVVEDAIQIGQMLPFVFTTSYKDEDARLNLVKSSLFGQGQVFKYEDGFLYIDGVIRFGGTCESVDIDENTKRIVDMEIVEIGFSE